MVSLISNTVPGLCKAEGKNKDVKITSKPGLHSQRTTEDPQTWQKIVADVSSGALGITINVLLLRLGLSTIIKC